MKMFIPILFIVAVTLAEPPVGDGYAAARSTHDEHHQDQHASSHQRSPSQEYGPPSDTIESARNAPSDGYDYNAPNVKNTLNARGQSRFPPATVRVSFNQRFSSAATRNSNNASTRSHLQKHSTPNTRSVISQEYGAPATRSPSQEYGVPESRSLSQEYGVPSVVSARTLSTEYGMPDARSAPSQDYSTRVVATRSNQKPHPANFRTAHPPNSPSHHHSSPTSKSQFETDSLPHDYTIPSARSNDISEGYEAPKSSFGSRTAPSSTHGAPSSRSSTSHGLSSSRNSDSQIVDSISETYGAPNQRSLDETYGDPSARGLSQEYGATSTRANLMTSAVPSTFPSPSSKSSPSSRYLPASRSAAPSDQYRVPEQRDSAGQGYDYARARALEELQNQEPASYDFGYQIEDQESGSDFGHTETREAGKAWGSYFVVRPDGSKQTVQYEADERGFKPVISVEPADAASARAAGYDQNAQDGTASDQGPY